MPRSAKELQTEIDALKHKQRQLESRLEFSQRLILEDLLEGMVHLDMSGQIIQINRAALRFWGKPREDIVGKHFAEINILPPDDLARIKLLFKRVLKKKRAHFQMKTKNLKMENIYLECSATQVKHDQKVAGIILVMRNITNRKKAEAELRESQRSLETLFANLPGMAYRGKNDADWTMEFISDGCFDLTGYDKKDLLNNSRISYNQIIHPDDRAYVAGYVKNGVHFQKKFFMEYRIVTKLGAVKTVWEGGCGIFDKTQNLISLEGFIMDITRRVAAEKQMRESEEKHRLLFETMAQGVIYYNSDGNIISVNPAAERILGVSAADFLNHGFFDFFTDAVTENGQPFESVNYPTRLSLKTGIPQCNVIMGIHHPIEKKQKWIEINSVPQCRKNETKPYQVYMTFTDITERQEQEQERKQLITALEQSKDMVIITDAMSLVIYVNPAFEKASGYCRSDVIEKPLEFLCAEEDRPAFSKKIWSQISNGKTWQGNFLKQHRDGTPLHEQTIICPVFSESGQIENFVAVIRDMNHEMALEEQLRQSQKMEAIGRLAGGVAHDFNNLLTVITGYSELLLSEPDFPTKFSDEITQIQRAGDQAAALTRQLLAFSRKQLLQPKILELNTLITRSIKMYQRLLSADIRVILNLQAGIPAIFADPHQIEQILINLIVNARDAISDNSSATQPKEITIGTASIYLDKEYTAAHLDSTEGLKTVISIKDTGSGMAPDVVEKIFEPFYTTKKMGKGTGLGLSTVYGIVRQNNASISVHSEPGVGSDFQIFWPAKEEVLEETATTDHLPEKGREKILVVEDEHRVRTFTKSVLENLGYSVIAAKNAETALELFKTVGKHIDLVLTDLVMPGLSGRELADLLLAERPKLPIIFFSGYSDDHIFRDGIQNENTCFIQKPFTIDILSKTVRKQLAAAK